MAENPSIDPDIALFILEFLILQPIEDSLLTAFLHILPIPEHDSTFRKLLLLRKLKSEVRNCIISENTLEDLDKIHELDLCLGVRECSEALKKAYCAVAVEFSVRVLRESGNAFEGEYFNVVKRIWKGRVSEMELANVGLVSDELLGWRVAIEDAVWGESACERLVEKCKEIDALETVRVYLEDEKSRMGPSFIEMASGVSSSDVYRRRYDRSGRGADKGKAVMVDRREWRLSKCQRVANRRVKVGGCGSSRGVNFDVEESGEGQVEKLQDRSDKYSDPPIDRNLELPGGEDRGKSLEENAENAHSGEADLGVENMEFEPPVDLNRAESSGVDNDVNVQSVDSGVNVQSSEADAVNPNRCGPRNLPKSLKDRNKTACTIKWDDILDGSSVERLKKKRVLPGFKQQDLRPPKKKWSSDEEAALLAGVQEFGGTHWTDIFNAHRDKFHGRKPGDLKDKWRNLTRVK